MCDQKTKRFRIVEVQIDNVSSQSHPFGMEDVLQKAKRISAIQVYKATEYAKSPLSGKANVSAGVFANASLILGTNEGDEPIFNIPLADLCASNNSGKIREFDISNINPSRCKIFVSDVAGLSVNERFILGFHYE